MLMIVVIELSNAGDPITYNVIGPEGMFCSSYICYIVSLKFIFCFVFAFANSQTIEIDKLINRFLNQHTHYHHHHNFRFNFMTI